MIYILLGWLLGNPTLIEIEKNTPINIEIKKDIPLELEKTKIADKKKKDLDELNSIKEVDFVLELMKDDLEEKVEKDKSENLSKNDQSEAENPAKKDSQTKKLIPEDKKSEESLQNDFLEKINDLTPIIEKEKNEEMAVEDSLELQDKSEPTSITKSMTTPEKVKAIYLTGYSFASEKRRNELVNLIKKTELNSVVIDIQDPHGYFMFPVADELLKNIRLSTISFSREKFRGILAELQEAGIYTIARVTTFQDEGAVAAFPDLNLKNKSGYKWKNYKGIGWLDMTNEEAWEIPFKKAEESAKIGFDEIQFDYIRFPSDGYISQIGYKNLGERKKYEVLEEFFEFLYKNKKIIGVPTSIDLFGVTYAKYTNIERDLAIGQRLIGAAKYFDYLSPMIYPSHYANGHMGYQNPAKFPYEVVYKAINDGHEMIEKHTDEPVSKTRPWLQAFNLGATYDYQKIRSQIQAVNENNGSGWILWSARNVYDQAF